MRHLIMGQIITTQNLVATKVVRHAGQWIKLAAILRQPQCVNWWSWLFSYLLEISRCSAGCISTMSLLGIVLWWKAAYIQRLLHSHPPLKYFGNSYQSHEQTICCNRDQRMFRLANHKRVMPAKCRPCNFSYPTDSPNATRLRLRSSL